MSHVTVRDWACSVSRLSPGGAPSIVVPSRPRVFRADIRLSSLVLANALATKIPGTVGYFARRHELTLLLSCLDDSPNRPLRLRDAAFFGSAGHIRRFISECTGMGLLTASAEQLYAWRAHPRLIANFDVLPTHLAARFARQGVRPDLLFSLPRGSVAGEARGRSRRSVPRTVQKRQRDRLDEILLWSQAHGDHPFLMSWAWITPSGVTVDVFHIRDPSWPDPVVPEQPEGDDGGEGPARYRPADPVREAPRDDARARVRDAPVNPAAEDDEEFAPGEDQFLQRVEPDRVPVPDLLRDGAAEATLMFQHLFESAPAETERNAPRLLGIPVRGSWVRADLLGPSPTKFFLGVLAEPLTPHDITPATAPTPTEQPDDDTAIDAQLNGRLIAVVSRSPGDELPTWSRVEATLLGN